MFRKLNLKQVYDSDRDDLLNDFYIPVLSNSISYRRISGYFSSASLLIAAKGISHFVCNNGIYYLIIGATLSENDYRAFVSSSIDKAKFMADRLLFDPNNIQDTIEKDHLRIMSWLIANEKLRIKIAIIPESKSAIFHEKIGILQDSNNDTIAFSGSINESIGGWLNNIEEFKLFRSWIPEERSYLTNDMSKFDNYWNNKSRNFTVINLPDAIKQRIITIKPTDKEYTELVSKLKHTKGKQLFDYQIEALNAWTKNRYKGILAMATGTGKTFTAISAINKISQEKKECCTIIAVPYKHLLTQWATEIHRVCPNTMLIQAYSNNPKWRYELKSALAHYNDGFIRNVVTVTSYNSLASEDFSLIFQKEYNKNRPYLLIADEVHNFGAAELSKGMLTNIQMRLGLSATPLRYFDDEGTKKIEEYFNKVVFSYNIETAIRNEKLTPYEYHPRFVEMTNEEFNDYLEISRKLFGTTEDADLNQYLKRLLIKRSRIIKNCVNKFKDLEELIDSFGKDADHLLIYCDNTKQLEHTQQILNSKGIISHRFTSQEGIEERRLILDKFDKGLYQCLIAMKCLDEGVDVPSTRSAIIMASSSSDREYIQRRGRVLRKYPGKAKSIIYDYIVLPPITISNDKLKKLEQIILQKELKRAADFLNICLNRASVLNVLTKIMLKYHVYLN